MTEDFTVAEFNKLIKAIKDNSSTDGIVFKLGNLLEIKPVFIENDKGEQELEGIDIYKYADPELMESEDYDFDADFITTIYY